jgi:hypothetical protein
MFQDNKYMFPEKCLRKAVSQTLKPENAALRLSWAMYWEFEGHSPKIRYIDCWSKQYWGFPQRRMVLAQENDPIFKVESNLYMEMELN